MSESYPFPPSSSIHAHSSIEARGEEKEREKEAPHPLPTAASAPTSTKAEAASVVLSLNHFSLFLLGPSVHPNKCAEAARQDPEEEEGVQRGSGTKRERQHTLGILLYPERRAPTKRRERGRLKSVVDDCCRFPLFLF